MDNNTDVSKSRHSVDEHSDLRTLKRIVPLEWPPERLQWLYVNLMREEYAFDDFAKQLGPQAFLGRVFNPQSEWYEAGNEGLAAVSDIVPLCDAVVHFVVWGNLEPQDILTMQRELFQSLFERFKLNRVSARIPAFNRQAVRMATLCGMKFEGEIRKVFLKNGVYHNIHLYGILREEFFKREVRN